MSLLGVPMGDAPVMSAKAFREALEAAGGVPRAAVVLGSGLGDALAGWPVDARWSWAEFLAVPVVPGVPGHRREFVRARAGDAGTPVLLVAGRLHLYQGVVVERLGDYVRLLAAVGVETLVLTNAAGGLNPAFRVGDLMLISDHLNLPGLAGNHPLRGGPHFLDCTAVYDPALRTAAYAAAEQTGQSLREGVYAMVAGPGYETPAEQRMLRTLGADAVGMSTAPEALVARQCDLRVLGFSSITNVAGAATISHAEVLRDGAGIATRLAALLVALLPEIVGQ
jgi:purine-nucleoside phosphorylase